MLSTEGIVLPAKVIRRGIETYTMHVEQGSTVIETPLREQRIASVFRGFGPKGTTNEEFESFDNYLLSECVAKGANKIHDKVKEVVRTPKGILIKTKNYQLLMSTGNMKLLQNSFD